MYKLKNQKIEIDTHTWPMGHNYKYYLNDNFIFEVSGWDWNLINADTHFMDIFKQDVKRVISILNKNKDYVFESYSREEKIAEHLKEEQ